MKLQTVLSVLLIFSFSSKVHAYSIDITPQDYESYEIDYDEECEGFEYELEYDCGDYEFEEEEDFEYYDCFEVEYDFCYSID